MIALLVYWCFLFCHLPVFHEQAGDVTPGCVVVDSYVVQPADAALFDVSAAEVLDLLGGFISQSQRSSQAVFYPACKRRDMSVLLAFYPIFRVEHRAVENNFTRLIGNVLKIRGDTLA